MKTLRSLLCLLLFLVGVISYAQEIEQRNFTVQIKDEQSGSVTHPPVNYVVFMGKYGEATQAREKIMRDYRNDPMFDLAVEVSKMKKDLRTSRSNGTFKTGSLIEGSGVLVIASGGEIVEAVKIVKGKLDYEVTLVTKTTLKEVIATGTSKVPDIVVKPVPGMDTGTEVTFNINFQLKPGIANETSRIIVQPAAMDCTTEDTVAFLKPAVFEGAKYHELQVRRKDFDFAHKDSLARGYDSAVVLRSDLPVAVNFNTEPYHKANKERTYKGVYRYVVEDYHHIIYDNGWDGTGSCLSFKPYKFLDFSDGGAELELTDEFFTPPEDNVRKVNTPLKLSFEQGKGDVLTSDSINGIELNRLERDLRAAGGKVFKITIKGFSSPEGSVERNKLLANQRAQYAKSLVSRFVRGVTIGTEEAQVYTWKDKEFLDAVKRHGSQETVEQVGNIIANNDEKSVYGMLKALPGFEQEIEPALKDLRVMRCTYLMEIQHVMNESEVVQYYYANKDSLRNQTKTLSDGDYYNLFKAVTDSAELDDITEMAYKHIISQPAYENLPLAPYVANRMALLNIRRGMPDLNVLRPFIDFTKPINGFHIVDMDTKYRVNRIEQLINQAISYFQDGRLDTASFLLVDRGDGSGQAYVPKTERTKKMRNYITFSYNYIPMLNNALDASKIPATKEAATYVFGTGKENKAILFTELHGHLNKTREECEALIDQLDDSNPKKWYLKGIIWADENIVGKEPSVEDGDADNAFHELSDAELMELQTNDPDSLNRYYEAEAKYNAKMKNAPKDEEQKVVVPHYLAYFQHCFDLEPKFKRFYFNEGNVSDKLRKAHPYRKKEIPAYRKLFANIIKQRDNMRTLESPAQETPAPTDQPSTTEEAANTENQ